MEITVIDDSDHVGWAAGLVRFGEIYMDDVKSMVSNVLKKAASEKISRLNILDHGNSKVIQIGSDVIDTSNIAGFEPQLVRLRAKFSKNGFAHLQHCNAGQNIPPVVAHSR